MTDIFTIIFHYLSLKKQTVNDGILTQGILLRVDSKVLPLFATPSFPSPTCIEDLIQIGFSEFKVDFFIDIIIVGGYYIMDTGVGPIKK